MTLDAAPTRLVSAGPVLVVAAHQLLGETLQLTLATHGLGVKVSTSALPDRILEEASQTKPALVVLDLEICGVDRTAELIRSLVEAGSSVLVLAGRVERLDLARCLEAGADGVLPKASSLQTVLEAIEVALAGSAVTPVSLRVALLAELCDERRARRASLASFDSLTPRECRVMSCILDGLSAAAIADRSYVSLATVRTQIRSILAKLGVNSQLAAVALARSTGWGLAMGEVI